jgi:hypothetical protein
MREVLDLDNGVRTFAFAHFLEASEGRSNCRCVTRFRPDACSADGRLVFHAHFSVYATRRDQFGALQRVVAQEAVTDLVKAGVAKDADNESSMKRLSAERLDGSFER